MRSSIHRSCWKIVAFRFEIQRPERLLVLRNILSQHIPQRFCLLRAEKYRLMVMDGHLVRAFAGSKSKNKLKIPNADPNLDAVGIRFAVVGRLGKVQLRLLRSRAHDQ